MCRLDVHQCVEFLSTRGGSNTISDIATSDPEIQVCIVCVCVCVCVNACVSVSGCMHMDEHVCVHACVHVCIFPNILS